MRASVATFIATGAYVGYVPVAPGTFGSLVGIALLFAVRATGVWWLEAVLLVLTFGAGLWAADLLERNHGKDPSIVVIDEVLGMLVTLAFVELSLGVVALGFFLFRALDVWKPFPARRFESLPGGLGIMADDLMAGLYSHVALRGVVAVWPGAFV